VLGREGYEGERHPLPRRLARPVRPAFEAGRQWPRVSEPAVPSGNRDENRANRGQKGKRNESFDFPFHEHAARGSHADD